MSVDKNIDNEKDLLEEVENKEWLQSLDYVLNTYGSERVNRLLRKLHIHARKAGVNIPFTANTPYINTIPLDKQENFPGSIEIERRIRSYIRWNAMAMVVRANRHSDGIGGHISTYASAATLYDIGFNHFFRARTEKQEGDIIYFQGHASPGIYSRAFLEGRLDIEHLENFRNEVSSDKGLSSYPHPWLMPEFWQFPTVSMGLSPIMAIYQARFNRYLEDRELKKETDSKVWAFLGDGETDEPETLGAITLASREELDNLIFVVNCNLQRLDGPVRGNGKIIQELEAIFRGAGWNVIKVIWGNDWDPLLAADKDDILVDRMQRAVDGDYQKYIVEPGSYIREHFFGTDPRLKKLVEHYTDEQLERLRRGGHDSEKVYTAYKAAVDHKGSPTVILAKTIKGYGLGESGEGKNITHQQKKLNEDELKEFRTRFGIPISDEDVSKAPFYKPDENSKEIIYLKNCRERLGGAIPKRNTKITKFKMPSDEIYNEFIDGSGDREVPTTMAFVRILSKLLRDKNVGDLIVPIVPDEARTFGMEALFRQVGIYSHVGQLYEPVDKETLLYYKEALDGQILEEGITEAGSMSSFIAAGTSYSTHGINTIPFFIYYSMFGMQRIGDLVWAAGDMKCKGFLIGGTAGRTTLAGEGLQHQDGHSHLLAYPVPNLLAYDPAYAYEIAVIIKNGMERMYVKGDDVFYYLTIMNEGYIQPPMPKGSEEGIIKGIYKLNSSDNKDSKLKVSLLGSGTILNESIKAKKILEEEYELSVDLFSVTSYKELYKDCLETERWNMLHPSEISKSTFLSKVIDHDSDIIVAASDYVKTLPESISSWLPAKCISLGTDGFGRSASRDDLRSFFEVDYRYIVLASLYGLSKDKKVKTELVQKACKKFDIDTTKDNPFIS